MKLTPKPLKVKVERTLLNTVSNYLMNCAMTGFDGHNNYRKLQPIREELFIYHLKTLIDQVTEAIYKKGQDTDVKTVTLKINHAERVTLSNLFRRVEVPPILRSFETSIINQLTLFLK